MNKETCRSGRHAWVEENIYRAPGGATKYCYPCARERKGQRAQAVVEGRAPERSQHSGPRRLTQKQIDALRSLLGCVVCRQTPGDDGWINHLAGCTVPLNVEGTPTKRGRPRRARHDDTVPEEVTWNRRCVVCEGPVPPPPDDLSGRRGAAVTRKICSDECRRARRSAAVRAKRASRRSVA